MVLYQQVGYFWEFAIAKYRDTSFSFLIERVDVDTNCHRGNPSTIRHGPFCAHGTVEPVPCLHPTMMNSWGVPSVLGSRRCRLVPITHGMSPGLRFRPTLTRRSDHQLSWIKKIALESIGSRCSGEQAVQSEVLLHGVGAEIK